MASTARGLTGATHNSIGNTTSTTATSENCVPTASAIANPSNKIRREFHSTTSRGAYSVWATAIPVNTIPNAPHTTLISPKFRVPATARIMPGEKQYSANAMYPPIFPYRRRDTYHSDAPSIAPKNKYGDAIQICPSTESGATSSTCARASAGAAATR